ncbi:MAG: glycosyltransferase family 4 protein [Synergistaceae bacterium]|nr:glycosyltransferase family 4 protein [Synergistaceae bacterium]
MKIGITSASVELVRRNGVKLQGIMWRNALAARGHDAELLNYWDDRDYSEFDAVIILRSVIGFRNIVNDLRNYGTRIISAPIFTPHRTMKMRELESRWGHEGSLRMDKQASEFLDTTKDVNMFLVRSEYEKENLCELYRVPTEKVRIVPLSFRIEPAETMPQKEKFCLHVSSLNAKNKNVERLINAAKRFGFDLVLGGAVRGGDGMNQLKEWIGDSKNIKYIGVLSDEELREWYMRAKVFALPSLWEGVGTAALEAASCGCEVVLTDFGAPKEYYAGLARLVNPKSIDSIGQGIIERLNCESDGELMRHIKKNYSHEQCSKLLESAVAECVRG